MVATAQVRSVGTAFLRQRPLVTLPAMLIVYALFVAGGAPRGQLIALGAGFTAMQGLFVTERLLGARRPWTAAALARSLALTALGLALGCGVTGALASPMVPLLLAPTGIGFAAFGRGRASAGLLGLLVATVFGLALAPHPARFPVLTAPHRELALAVTVTACAVLLRLGVAALADAHAAAAATLGRAGDDAAWAATARARELETLGARVAHEVKNPLAAIRGLVEVMIEARRDLAADDRDHRRLTVVAGEVARIEGLLRDYLERHRPTADLERVEVDVGELGRDVAAVLEARAARAGVHLTVAGAVTRAAVDQRRLKEALLNLALNALDATAPGGGVALRWRTVDGDTVIELVDQGRGMTGDELARLGTPGFTTRAGGTGLGVALARAVVEHHGGTLTFTSTPGQGTIATIRLPPGSPDQAPP